jgi:uncharacterized membrane protein
MHQERTAREIRFEQLIARILQAGVLLSAVFVLAGGVAHLIRHGSDIAGYGVFSRLGAHTLSLHGIVANVRAFDAYGLIQLGLLVLIATPVVRVLISAISFAAARDRVYVIVTLVVLAVLLYSLFVRG